MTGALDKEFGFVDAVIANNKALGKALEEARETDKDIDALYAAANADIIINMGQGPIPFWLGDKPKVTKFITSDKSLKPST